jgi:hypothetical protein
MERMDASQARDHLEMVDRILAESCQRLCAGGEYFVVWGVGSACVTTLFTLAGAGLVRPAALWAIPAILIACAVFSVLRGRSTRRTLARSSLVQREFFRVLWLTLALAFVVNVGAFRLFPGIAAAAIWSVAAAIVLFFIGMHGNLRAQVAGIVVVASLVVANFAPGATAGYVLAAGMLLGYAGFGLAELLVHE